MMDDFGTKYPVGGWSAHANFIPAAQGSRVGYRSVWSLLWMVYKMNRAAKKSGISSNLNIRLPIR